MITCKSKEESIVERIIVCNLKQLLEERGLEQKQLSEMTKIREATISEMVRNKNKMFPRHVLEKIANALDIDDISKIITFKQNMD
ncbi:XRE family transcriptional regulator [Paenibacillus popilliae]|uniref:XRE family transcriptional regulator n=1 Tax=Paenibacillus popilliae TaxID=78057 RepID=A0ABY3AQ28_PAEPP|nr:XRE family transcriptional regulator [Paenibacillus sp. SDF0028]